MTYNPRPADLSARDLFAMAALVGILADATNTSDNSDISDIAYIVYAYADAMLKARKERSDD